jgi:hypothetical protein
MQTFIGPHADGLMSQVSKSAQWVGQRERTNMKSFLKTVMLFLVLAGGGAIAATASAPMPTIVLVHGVWDQADVWRGVRSFLRKNGYHVVIVTPSGRRFNRTEPAARSRYGFQDELVRAPPDHDGRAPVRWTFGPGDRRSRT